MAKNVFEVMQTALTTTRASDQEIQSIPPFIWQRWLSNNQNVIQMANMFNTKNIPITCQYDSVQAIFGGKIKFIKYPKTLKDQSVEIDLVSAYYNISKEKAKMYLEYLTQEDLKNIQQEQDSLKPKKSSK